MKDAKGNKIKAIVWHKCPKCHQGDLFETSVWSFKKIFQMPDNCSVCKQKYVLEPGFYWGAMYISYMLSSGIMLSSFVVLYFLFGLGLYGTFGGILAIAALAYGFIFRMARSIWIHIYVRYDSNASQIKD